MTSQVNTKFQIKKVKLIRLVCWAWIKINQWKQKSINHNDYVVVQNSTIFKNARNYCFKNSNDVTVARKKYVIHILKSIECFRRTRHECSKVSHSMLTWNAIDREQLQSHEMLELKKFEIVFIKNDKTLDVFKNKSNFIDFEQ